MQVGNIMKNKNLTKKWERLLECVDYAYQPIVNIYTGDVYACEALIREYKKAGFASIDDVFNQAFDDEVLFTLDVELRTKAIEKFLKLPFNKGTKLFYNIDTRISQMRNYLVGLTQKRRKTLGLNINSEDICFELSEKNDSEPYYKEEEIMNIYQTQEYKVAIDDFGTGYAGLKMLYNIQPNFIKIDRFFVTNITSDQRKQIFVKSVVEIAQSLGTQVIAEGIETKEEFLTCKDLGCNMAQGYYIAKPTQKLQDLQNTYTHIRELNKKSKREEKNAKSIKSVIKRVDYAFTHTKISEILSRFREDKKLRIVPIVGRDQTPLGVVKEDSLKDYIYSPYGWALLENETRENILSFISPCSVADINDSLDKILKIYTYNKNSEGIIITKNDRYYGFLNAQSILNLVSNKNLLAARDQNPLTKLPGNIIINEFLLSCINSKKPFFIVYFDLDNFKAFNDRYGFRNGDRIIMLFGNLIKKAKEGIKKGSLAGHIGGDDFFLGVQLDEDENFEKNYILISTIIRKFALDAESFYTKEDRQARFIISKNRKNEVEKFPLITASAAMLMVRNQKDEKISIEAVGEVCAKLKKQAKSISGNSVICASNI